MLAISYSFNILQVVEIKKTTVKVTGPVSVQHINHGQQIIVESFVIYVAHAENVSSIDG